MTLIVALIGVGALVVLWGMFGVQVAKWVGQRREQATTMPATSTTPEQAAPPAAGHELYPGCVVIGWSCWNSFWNEREFYFADGRIVRDDRGYKHYPSGDDVGIASELYKSLKKFEQQIDWGQHGHLKRGRA